MSGDVTCKIINTIDHDTYIYDLSAAVTGTSVIFGKNQPFLGIEITVSRYVFDSQEFWDAQSRGRPNLIENQTIFQVETYGGSYELLYTQTLNPDDSSYVFICYSKTYQLKTTYISSILKNVVWNGNTSSYANGEVEVIYNNNTTTFDLTKLDDDVTKVENVQVIRPSKLIATRSSTDPYAQVDIGTFRMLIPIAGATSLDFTNFDMDDIQGSIEAYGTAIASNLILASVTFQYVTPAYDGQIVAGNPLANPVHPSTNVQVEYINERPVVRWGDTTSRGVLLCQGIEYVCGTTDALFKWIVKAFEPTAEFTLDAPYSYDAPILEKNEYYDWELARIKTSSPIFGDSVCKFKPTSNCYNAVQALALLTNRYAYFADKAYLSSFRIVDEFADSSVQEIGILYNADGQNYSAYAQRYSEAGEDPVIQEIKLGSGVVYNNQGSTYLIGQQTAINADATVSIKLVNAGTDIEGTPVEVEFSTDSKEESLAQLWKLALNSLIHNYLPSNTLSFIALENKSILADTDYVAYMEITENASGLPTRSSETYDKYFVKYNVEDVNLYYDNGTSWDTIVPAEDDTVTVITSSRTYQFQFDGTMWDEIIGRESVVRDAIFTPDTRCGMVMDQRSGATLQPDVPLAYTVLSWPECTSRYMFGEPVFQDTEEAISDLQAIAQKSVSNISLSEYLNQSYTTISLGDKSIRDNANNLEDYSGIIMQRNDATGVASIDGYMGGERQITFSNKGQISCGALKYINRDNNEIEAGDSVIMDRLGFRTRSWHMYNSFAPEYPYLDGYWVTETSVGTDGKITAAGGKIELGADGLIYEGRSVIDLTEGKVSLKVDSSVVDGDIRAKRILLPQVQIDNYGMRTFSKYYFDTDTNQYVYDPRDLQCAVGTDGIIVAGAGAVRLDATGVTTWSGVTPVYVDPSNPGPIVDGERVGAGYFEYSNAIKQCAMTTNGQFVAGQTGTGWSVMDALGLKIYTKGTDPTAEGVSRSPVVWVDSDGFHQDNSKNATLEDMTIQYGSWAHYNDVQGDIKANINLLSNVKLNAGPVCYNAQTGAEYYSVVLDAFGLKTYSYDSTKYNPQTGVVTDPTIEGQLQCSIDTTGKILAGGGAVQLDQSGLTTFDTTGQTPVKQCEVSTNGKIVAGANLVTLSDTGIIVGTASDAPPSLISLGSTSSIEILDSTSTPAISLTQAGSTFRNQVEFGKSISVNGGAIKLGEEGSQISTGKMSINVVGEGTSQVHESYIVNTFAASGEVMAGKYNATPTDYLTYLNTQYYPGEATPAPVILDSVGIDIPQEKSGLVTITGQANLPDILISNTASQCYFSYNTAKSPQNWPELTLKLNGDNGLDISNVLHTQPYIPSGETTYKLSGHTEFNVVLGFGANQALDATLAEMVEVTIGYTLASFDSTQQSPVTPSQTIQYLTQTLSLYANDSGNKTFSFVLPQQFFRENGAIVGTFVHKIKTIKILIKLPLQRTVNIRSVMAGTLAASGEGAFFVSKFGAWGSTPTIDPATADIVPNTISPMVNTTYLGNIVSAIYSTGLASTTASTSGVRNILLVGYNSGSSPSLPSTAREGDIVMCYVI